MKTKINYSDPSFMLAALSTVLAVGAEVHIFSGEPLSIWTVMFWMVGVTCSFFPLLLTFDVDPLSTLMRLAFGAIVLLVFKLRLQFGLQDDGWTYTIAFIWRWIDISLMWLNWKRCQS